MLDYTDDEGFMVRVFIPEGMEYDHPSEGIPLSLDLREVYPDVPVEFLRKLNESLWAVGLILPSDYTKPGAAEKVRSAILSATRFDTMTILTEAKRRATK